MSKSKKSRPAAPRRNLGVESLENRVVFAADFPSAVNDLYIALPDQPFESPAPGVFANDAAAAGGALSAQLFSGTAHGALDLRADGSFQYVPESGFEGVDSFVYLANEGDLSSSLAAVTLRVERPQSAPLSVNDVYGMNEDESLSITPELGVLANDSDADGDTLAASLMSGPANGSVALNADGSFSYTPNANFSGIDGFSYIVNDGTLNSSVATVTINVSDANDAPLAVNDEFSLDEDNALTIDPSGVLANDTDADGDTLTSLLEEGPAHGSIVLNADGSFTYTPNAGFNGVDAFSYVVSDGQAESDVAAVTLNVNAVADAPVSVNDEFTTGEDTPLVIELPGVLANDTDADGDTLTAVLESGPANGTLVLNPDGSFTYTPNADFQGADGFSYVVSDGTNESDVAAVTINVTPANDAPVCNDDEFTVEEDVTLIIDLPGVLVNDTDVDGDPLSAILVTGPTNGSLSLNADGSFSYTPNANFHGIDLFTYKVNDGTQDSSEATVTINVTPANDAPIANSDVYATTEDASLTVELPGVLVNDTDADGDPLTAALVAGPANGSVVLNPDGSFTYTPNPNFHGVDVFTYKVSDGELESSEATVTIDVASANDVPVAADDEFSMDEDATLTIDPAGVLANDTDVEGTALNVTLGVEPENGTVVLNSDGSFTYTPAANFNGVDSFTYSASDGEATSAEATVTITVNDTPDASVILSDAYSVGEDNTLAISAEMGVLANDFDPQDLPLGVALSSGPSRGSLTLNADGSFTYVPEPNFVGVDSFTYVAQNGLEDSAPVTATIVVEPINDAPTAAGDEYLATAGQSLAIDAAGGVVANDSDIEGNALAAGLVRGPEHGTLVLNADGSFSYTPEEGYVGADSFTYQLNDGMANSNVATVSISVGAATVDENLRPEAANDRFTVEAGGTLTVEAAGVLANDTDAEGAALSATLFAPPQNGLIDFQADGSFVYKPNDGFAGRDSFMYRVSDGELYSAYAAVTLYVQAVAPVETPVTEPIEVDVDAPIEEPVLAPIDTPAEEPTEIVCETIAPPPCEVEPVAEVAEEAQECGLNRFRVRVGVAIDGLMAARVSDGTDGAHIDAVFSGRGWWM